MNTCVFSPCRRYRYTLKHRWDELMPERAIVWIGLNPSTADEQQLDPTLRRIRGFSTAWGYNAFYMLNLFAFRATDPRDMIREPAPIGDDNDRLIADTVSAAADHLVVAAWGGDGGHMSRASLVLALLGGCGARVVCLGKNGDGTPRHPLYVAAATSPMPFP